MESRLVCHHWWQLIQSTPTLWVTVVDLQGPRCFGTEGQSSYQIGQLLDGDSDLDIFLPSCVTHDIFPTLAEEMHQIIASLVLHAC